MDIQEIKRMVLIAKKKAELEAAYFAKLCDMLEVTEVDEKLLEEQIRTALLTKVHTEDL